MESSEDQTPESQDINLYPNSGPNQLKRLAKDDATKEKDDQNLGPVRKSQRIKVHAKSPAEIVPKIPDKPSTNISAGHLGHQFDASGPSESSQRKKKLKKGPSTRTRTREKVKAAHKNVQKNTEQMSGANRVPNNLVVNLVLERMKIEADGLRPFPKVEPEEQEDLNELDEDGHHPNYIIFPPCLEFEEEIDIDIKLETENCDVREEKHFENGDDPVSQSPIKEEPSEHGMNFEGEAIFGLEDENLHSEKGDPLESDKIVINLGQSQDQTLETGNKGPPPVEDSERRLLLLMQKDYFDKKYLATMSGFFNKDHGPLLDDDAVKFNENLTGMMSRFVDRPKSCQNDELKVYRWFTRKNMNFGNVLLRQIDQLAVGRQPPFRCYYCDKLLNRTLFNSHMEEEHLVISANKYDPYSLLFEKEYQKEETRRYSYYSDTEKEKLKLDVQDEVANPYNNLKLTLEESQGKVQNNPLQGGLDIFDDELDEWDKCDDRINVWESASSPGRRLILLLQEDFYWGKSVEVILLAGRPDTGRAGRASFFPTEIPDDALQRTFEVPAMTYSNQELIKHRWNKRDYWESGNVLFGILNGQKFDSLYCFFCNQSFHSKYWFELHMNEKHIFRPANVCVYCDEICKVKNGKRLEDHKCRLIYTHHRNKYLAG